MAIRIITDSTADFTRAEAEELGLEVVALRTRFGAEEYIDGVTISPREFYEKLVESDELPMTSQPSPAEFEAAYRARAGAGGRGGGDNHLVGALGDVPERDDSGGAV